MIVLALTYPSCFMARNTSCMMSCGLLCDRIPKHNHHRVHRHVASAHQVMPLLCRKLPTLTYPNATLPSSHWGSFSALWPASCPTWRSYWTFLKRTNTIAEANCKTLSSTRYRQLNFVVDRQTTVILAANQTEVTELTWHSFGMSLDTYGVTGRVLLQNHTNAQ